MNTVARMSSRPDLSPEQRREAERLKELFEFKKKMHPSLTQDTLGEALGISQAAVSQYLRGVIPLNTDVIVKFAQALGVQPNQIRLDFNERFAAGTGLSESMTEEEKHLLKLAQKIASLPQASRQFLEHYLEELSDD